METNTEKKCKGCDMHTLRTEDVLNSLSRYGHGYICGMCGTREAFQGDFIRAELKDLYQPSNDENLEYCVSDMQCYECGNEIDYRISDGNTCNCMCHELV